MIILFLHGLIAYLFHLIRDIPGTSTYLAKYAEEMWRLILVVDTRLSVDVPGRRFVYTATVCLQEGSSNNPWCLFTKNVPLTPNESSCILCYVLPRRFYMSAIILPICARLGIFGIVPTTCALQLRGLVNCISTTVAGRSLDGVGALRI